MDLSKFSPAGIEEKALIRKQLNLPEDKKIVLHVGHIKPNRLDKTKYRPVICLSQKTNVFELYEKEGIKTHVIDMERIKKSVILKKIQFTLSAPGKHTQGNW